MARQRHNDPPPTSSRNALVFLTAGGLLVAALVAWALMRTVQAPGDSGDQPPAAETPIASGTAPVTIDTSGGSSTATSTTPPRVEGEREVARISAEDLRERQRRGEVTVIDVRDAAAFEARHIPGSLNLPFASIEGLVDMIPKGKPIVTYCTWPAEESSAGAALILENRGFTNVSALFGGLDAWSRLGYPVESGR